MVKAVVFDLDDTLISEREYIKSGFKVISKYLSKEYNLEQSKIFDLMNRLFEESPKQLFNRLLDKLEITYDLEYIKSLVKTYREHEPDIKFFEDVVPTIIELKKRGFKIGMITDGYKETQRAKIKVLNCEGLFDEIIVTDELGREFWKPHMKSYELLKKKFECEFESMSYVGDNEEKDFVTCNKLGINTLKINRELGVYKNIKALDKNFKANIDIKCFENLLEVI